MGGPLTPEYLAGFRLIILQSLGDGNEGDGPYWDSRVTDSDLKNLEAWVRRGGAIIATTGYGTDPTEVNPVNKLLAFSGISYNTDDIFVSGDSYDYCRWGLAPFYGWTNNDLELAHNLRAVGVSHGHSIRCDDPACVTIGQLGDAKVAVARVVDNGHVFAFADDEVTNASQWGLPDTCAGLVSPTSGPGTRLLLRRVN